LPPRLARRVGPTPTGKPPTLFTPTSSTTRGPCGYSCQRQVVPSWPSDLPGGISAPWPKDAAGQKSGKCRDRAPSR
jgi:hypothetical protein